MTTEAPKGNTEEKVENALATSMNALEEIMGGVPIRTTAEVIPPAKVKKVRTELKVNIIIKGDKIFLGAQATDCDPKMTTLTGGLPEAIARIPSFVEESNAQWDVAAHNPNAPEPVAPPAPPRVASPAASKPATAKPAEKVQPNFF